MTSSPTSSGGPGPSSTSGGTDGPDPSSTSGGTGGTATDSETPSPSNSQCLASTVTSWAATTTVVSTVSVATATVTVTEGGGCSSSGSSSPDGSSPSTSATGTGTVTQPPLSSSTFTRPPVRCHFQLQPMLHITRPKLTPLPLLDYQHHHHEHHRDGWFWWLGIEPHVAGRGLAPRSAALVLESDPVFTKRGQVMLCGSLQLHLISVGYPFPSLLNGNTTNNNHIHVFKIIKYLHIRVQCISRVLHDSHPFSKGCR
jgi:hypothetical protein